MDEKKTARAEAKYVRIAPRKIQIICDMIRGEKTDLAMAYMKNTPKAGCEVMTKLLKSACANATHNFQMDESKLYVKACYADEGITLKRYMPRAKGSASSIMKRTSHITVVVAER